MRNYSDEQILKGILRHDNLILQYIYKEYYYKVSFFIKKNQGNEDDANDIFQEAIIVIYRKLKENDLIFAKSGSHLKSGGFAFSGINFCYSKQKIFNVTYASQCCSKSFQFSIERFC